MDGDFVNSIDDTEESMQVAQIVRSTYNAMMSNRNWAHTRHPIQLVPTANLAQPTHVTVPDKIKELYFINYNIAKAGDEQVSFVPMKWKEPDEFLQLTNYYNTSEDNVTTVVDDSGVSFQIMNDTAPSFYTSFDDRTLVFNSYDSAVESNITANRMQSMAYMMPDFIVQNSAIPNLPDDAFALLVESAKSKASWKLRQVADPAAQAEAKRQTKWLARNHRRVNKGIKYPNYGRK
jgi:uncharacterized protein with NAD-binding domain and iron-sulfur cluster